jgi:hypothetical protein
MVTITIVPRGDRPSDRNDRAAEEPARKRSGREPLPEPAPDPPLEDEVPWTLERLQALDPHEYDFQEFKGAGFVLDLTTRRLRSDFLDALSKQVSAFANAAGGRVFLGIDDAGRIDGGVPTDLRSNGTREWLEDVIPHVVAPNLRSLNVWEVAGPPVEADPASGASAADDAGPIRRGHAVYVIDIAMSEDAPHQARDHRYYLRIAGKSRPMGHHHVLDVLHRTRDPHVVVSRVDPYGEAELVGSDPRGPKALIHLRATLVNRGRTLAQHVGCEFIVPRFAVTSESQRRTLDGGQMRLLQRPGEAVFFYYHPIPVFPTQEVVAGDVWLIIHGANLHHFREGRVALRWRAFADAATVRQGRVDVGAFTAVRRGLRAVEAALPDAPRSLRTRLDASSSERLAAERGAEPKAPAPADP